MNDDPFPVKADRAIGHWLENASRRIGRRKALLNGLKAAAVAVAGITVGTLPSRAVAHPGHKYCHYPGVGHCAVLGKSCPSQGGCPSGCYVCTRYNCPDDCPYDSGYWATLSGSCGSQGYGYYLCYDCRCTGCGTLCGCRSACQCGGCRNRADVEADLKRTMAASAPGSR